MSKFIGDKAFYKSALTVALPIMVQNAITNFVSLLDNIMVGRVGTLPMSGVSIVNQLAFVYYLCVFGILAGAGIFTAQFSGCKDNDGVRYTFRFKFMSALLVSVLGMAVLLIWGEGLISLYLASEENRADAAATLVYAQEYLKFILIGFVPFALSSAYASTMRESGQTLVPMISGIVAVCVNLVLNYTLIFGHFGAPAMGVAGAALATTISRFAELAVNAAWLHRNSTRYPYIKGAYRSMYIPPVLLRQICFRGAPLLVNEALWSAGMAILNQSYATRGLAVIAATNISGTIWNLFSVCFLSMGNAVAIMVGRMLGAGEPAEAVKDTDRKLIAFSVASCALFGGLMAALSGLFPAIYNTTEEVRHLATQLICISALFMPFQAFTHATYFTLRSGGKTFITFLFDSCFVWLVNIPTAFCLTRFTGLPIIPIYIVCQGLELIKCALGAYMLHTGTWIQNIVSSD